MTDELTNQPVQKIHEFSKGDLNLLVPIGHSSSEKDFICILFEGVIVNLVGFT